MKLINRSALVIRPKQPYVDWVNSLDSEASGLEQAMTLAQHQQEGRVYLISEQEQVTDKESLIADHWQPIFENELGGWDEFADAWPASLSQQLFLEWFDIEPQLMVFDMTAEPLLVADMSEI